MDLWVKIIFMKTFLIILKNSKNKFYRSFYFIKKIINFILLNNIKGNISVISSVAGIRGRAKNYVYGASKSAINTFFSGLRQRYSKDNISFTSVILGFVNTKMTKDEKINKYLNSEPKNSKENC